MTYEKNQKGIKNIVMKMQQVYSVVRKAIDDYHMIDEGDKIAIVSLSWGGLGDEKLIHKYYIAKKRLENEF